MRARLDALWKESLAKLPTQTEAAVSAASIKPGEIVKPLKTYTFRAENTIFALPVNLSAGEQAYMQVTLSGFSDMALGRGEWVANSWVDGYYEGACFYQVKAPSDGIIEVEAGEDANLKALGMDAWHSVKTTLTDSKCKEISSSQTSTKSEKAVYYVKKATYYIKVSADGLFRFRYRFTKVKQPKNTKQTKALNIKKGKTVKGILSAGDGKKNCRWYKIVIPKTRKVSVTVKSLIGSDGSSKTYLYKKGQSKPIASSTWGMRKLIYMGGDEKYLFKTKFPLEKGTYYLKV